MLRSSVVLLTFFALAASAQTYTIRTAAGGGNPKSAPGTPGMGGAGVAVDRAGNVFYVGAQNASVWRLDASTSLLTRVAGNGVPGFGGDGGPAANAQLIAAGLAFDPAGNLYIADAFNNRVRKVVNGIITTVAGSGGPPGFSGDNGLAVNAQLNAPLSIAVDAAGAIYIADANNSRVRKVVNGVISTVAGNGNPFLGGDGGPAMLASLSPSAVTLDAAGNLYIADGSSSRIRKVVNGVISTIAGAPGTNGPGSFGGDGGPATSAQLSQPRGLAVDAAGVVYIADSGNHRIRKVANGVITTVAGSGTPGGAGGFGGDNGPATSATLAGPGTVALGPDGTLYIGDSNNARVRKISPQTGIISTLVATSGATMNGLATDVWLPQLAGVAVDAEGSLYFADGLNRNLRKVSGGVINTVAGGGSLGDGFPAIGAGVPGPKGVAVDAEGSVYISDSVTNTVRKVSHGIITTVAGNGIFGFSGDGGAGPSAQLAAPNGIAVDTAGNLYIADTNNNRIRKLSQGVLTTGVLTTVVGSGSTPGLGGDNGPATAAQLNFPVAVAVDKAGDLYIADGHRVRKVANGIITTVAGGVAAGFAGDGGPAVSARLDTIGGLTVDAAGNLYIADLGNRRVRKVSGGIITTIAGNGNPDFAFDNSPALAGGLGFLSINQPFVGMAVSSEGFLYFTESARVRMLVPASTCTTSARPATLQVPATGGNVTLSLQTDPSCPWQIGALPDWLTVVSATPLGQGLVAVTLFAEGSASPRSATIFAARDAIRVDQSGGATGPGLITAMTNAASNIGGPVSPGEIIVLYGAGLGPVQLAQARPDPGSAFPTNLAGTQVFFNGIPAPLIYSSIGQVAAIVPYGVSGPAQISVSFAPGQGVARAVVATTGAAPGLFTLDTTGKGQAAALHVDGTGNSVRNPVGVGGFVSLFATGEGQTWPAGADGKPTGESLPRPLLPVSVTVGGRSATVTYAGGAPGLVAGLLQINVQIPAGVAAGNAVPVTVEIGGIPAQGGVTLAVRN